MNDEEIISNKIARYMAEAGGDPRGAMRLMAYDLARLGDMVSLGFGRFPPVRQSGFAPKTPRLDAIDIPAAGSPEASTPL
jgi:hypothetical protein